jgi:TonB family protein
MSQPESYGTPPSWDQRSSDQRSLDQRSSDLRSPGRVGDVVSSENPRDVVEVARALAARGGGTGSFDLALDLILNEVVEQARVATGATGAAIALARAGEMVCRATAGADAPDLGVRLETTSGLSGACLQTGAMQHCGDTETDPRVNAEACRRLGVRSIMVLPLGDSQDTFGLLEVFSSRPYAFSDRDINTLQVLARRVVENKRGAEQVAEIAPSVSQAPSDGWETSHEDDQPWQPEAMSPMEERPARRSDVWSSILGVLVIVVAVLLGIAIGWRGAVAGRQMRSESQKQASVPSASRADRGPDSAGDSGNAPVPQPSQPQTPSAAPAVDAPSGGLVVTQNGKIIYRLPPAGQRAGSATSAASVGSEDASATRLIHRVEPQYPPDASARHIQGVVTLDVQIGGEGAVHNIVVVAGDPVLAEAAVQSVRQWRYQPYSVDGRPVEMQTRITIRFTLPPT